MQFNKVRILSASLSLRPPPVVRVEAGRLLLAGLAAAVVIVAAVAVAVPAGRAPALVVVVVGLSAAVALQDPDSIEKCLARIQIQFMKFIL